MIILILRTDKQEAEIGLYDNEKQLAYETWQAHRALAETLHQKINEVLSSQYKSLSNVRGIVCYKGPGSFTGLRIGLSVLNTFAYSLHIPIVGVEGEDKWLERGLAGMKAGKNDKAVLPVYGAPVHITVPRK